MEITFKEPVNQSHLLDIYIDNEWTATIKLRRGMIVLGNEGINISILRQILAEYDKRNAVKNSQQEMFRDMCASEYTNYLYGSDSEYKERF